MRTFVFSGPPGAGKTSLILALLARLVPDGWKIAVLENDAASQPLDARRLSGSGALVREIAAGCVCCSLAGDFALAVRELSAYEKPDFLLIEPSGIAAPQLVKQALTGLKEVTS
ncbi:MAG: cobalamin biosynthesis protein CobW, partial [Planctomycetota bacterium]|nr:cobalamin biosynthesis protein CobW [Planctomycetota bacterium]